MWDVRAVIASFFIMLKEDKNILMRIEGLVTLVTVMFLGTFLMDFRRCRSRSPKLATLSNAVDALSDNIVMYLLGAMQGADFDNPMFPVWAVVLVSLRASLGYLSGYGIPDRERRLTEVSNVMKFIGVGFLNGTRGLVFSRPLWSLWAILVVRSVYRFLAHYKAIRSLWHGRSSEFLPEHMRQGAQDHEQGSRSSDKKRHLLVYGESKQKLELEKPSYALRLEDLNSVSLITLDKISECPLLASNKHKDISLAFALSRLLRCRLEDVKLNTASSLRAHDLFTADDTGIQHMEAERAFSILELEIAFARDYFFTLYPVVFWRGLSSLHLSILQSMATFAVAFWLAVGIRRVYQPPAGNLVIWVNGRNVDVILTWVLMCCMMFKELWEVGSYLLSKWTGLLLVCNYVHNHAAKDIRCTRKALTGRLICLFFTCKTGSPWHGRIDQYEFLQSYTYKPSFGKLANTLTLGETTKKYDGRKPPGTIRISKCVKEAILQALKDIGLNRTQLPREIPTLNGSSQYERYKWACHELHTCSRVILVWHIATSLCDIKLVQDHPIDSTNSGHLPDDNGHQNGLKTNYHTANSLSRYCAYLQVFWPELLPDSYVEPNRIFVDTLRDARKQFKGCNLTRCKYNRLIQIAHEVKQGCGDRKLSEKNVVEQGAFLGKELIDNLDENTRWKLLAGVWADLLVQIAPSWKAADHKNNLNSGGELITLIWALLWHCGIEKSNLWHNDEVSESNAQVPQESNDQVPHESNDQVPQENSTEPSITQPVEGQPNEDGIESDQQPQTSNLSRRRGRKYSQADATKQTPIEIDGNNAISPSSSAN